MLKIIDKTILPDGTEVQLEDWSADNATGYHIGCSIGAFPIAQNTIRGYCTKNKPFRVTVYNHKGYTDDMLKIDYEALKNGTKTLTDLREHFWNRGMDCIALNCK